MRLLHTADWHIGQSLNGWNRDAEHEDFLCQLADIVQAQQIDVLLVAGDVFDGINPSGEAQRLLYEGLARLHRVKPDLTMILTSGNHDPAQRLEAPEAVLRPLGVRVIGTVKRVGGLVDLAHHLVPLRKGGKIAAYVLAIPFLRQADLPGLRLSEEGGVATAVATFHQDLVARARGVAGDLPLIAMGHLTCTGGLESEGAERRILLGGEHAVPPEVFPADLTYVALGHLHRAQSLQGGRVRYSGSPLPLSGSEIGYGHGVTLLDLDRSDGPIHLPLNRPVAMHRLPPRGDAPLEEILAAIKTLEVPEDIAPERRPFLYLSITPDRPARQIFEAVEGLLATRPLRLAGLSLPRAVGAGTNAPTLPASLADTDPEELFAAAFLDAHGTSPDPQHFAAFRDALSEV